MVLSTKLAPMTANGHAHAKGTSICLHHGLLINIDTKMILV